MPTLKALAEAIGGAVIGNAEHEVSDIADLSSAGPADLSFLTNVKYLPQFKNTRAGAVLVTAEMADAHTNLVVCDNPYLAMAQIATQLHPAPQPSAGISPQAFVHPEADVDPTASVAPLAFVDSGAKVGARTQLAGGTHVGRNAVLGEDGVVHPGAKILDRCIVGDRVILHAGAVVGSDGFGFAPDSEGRRMKIPQVGIVEIGDDVEIGANTTIDRATFGKTRIGNGTKLDNLVQVAHNVVLGEHVVAASQSGIAGSSTVGNCVVIGAQAGVTGHIKIGDQIVLAGRAGVTKPLNEPGVYAGFPAKPHRQWLKSVALQNSIPTMKQRIRDLEKSSNPEPA